MPQLLGSLVKEKERLQKQKDAAKRILPVLKDSFEPFEPFELWAFHQGFSGPSGSAHVRHHNGSGVSRNAAMFRLQRQSAQNSKRTLRQRT